MINRIRHIKVSQRIIIGFSIMILFLVIVSISGLIYLSKANSESQILGYTALAKYHTLLARHDANRYVNSPNEESMNFVGINLDEAVANATLAADMMNSNENQAIMRDLIDKLQLFRDSFSGIVQLQAEKEEAEAVRAAAVGEAENYIGMIIGIQENVIRNGKDVERAKEDFSVYQLAVNAHQDFISARSSVNDYIHTGNEGDYENGMTLLTKSLDNFLKAKEDATDPTFGIYLKYAEEKIAEYQASLDTFREIDQKQNTERVALETSAADVSMIATQGEEGVRAYIELMRIQALVIVSSITLITIGFGFFSTLVISTSIKRPLKDYIQKLNTFGKGDLTVHFDTEGKDELTEMGLALGQMEANLGEILHTVINTATEFKEISREVIERTHANNERIENELATTIQLSTENEESLRNVTIAIEEISKGTVSSAEAASDSVLAAGATKEISLKVSNDMNTINEEIAQVSQQSKNISMKMSDVTNSVKEINTFVQRINEIASQTNLLALNAAIEAARAGEQGKGFSVVADEVRKLSEESNKASNEISRIITILNEHSRIALLEITASEDSIQKVVNTTSDTKIEMGQSLDEIEKLSESMESIAAVTEEQASSSEEILATTETVLKATNDVVSSIGNVNDIARTSSATTSEDLSNIVDKANELVEILDFFTM